MFKNEFIVHRTVDHCKQNIHHLSSYHETHYFHHAENSGCNGNVGRPMLFSWENLWGKSYCMILMVSMSICSNSRMIGSGSAILFCYSFSQMISLITWSFLGNADCFLVPYFELSIRIRINGHAVVTHGLKWRFALLPVLALRKFLRHHKRKR